MHLQLSKEDKATAELTHVVLLYGDDYASIHSFANGQVMPGAPLDSAMLVSLLKNKGRKASLLPPRIIAMSESVLCWWRPAGLVTLVGDTLPRTAVNLPPLIFKVSGRDVLVGALAKDEHPTASTPVYHLPLPNIYEDHKVCWGSSKVPTDNNPASWESAFFDSGFNVLHKRGKFFNFKGGMKALWREATKKKFNPKWLAKHGTINEFINQGT